LSQRVYASMVEMTKTLAPESREILGSILD